MSPELRELVDEQAATFEALNNALDEMRGQVKKIGSADTVTNDKVDKINATLTDLQNRADQLETAYSRRGGITADNDNELIGQKALIAFESWRKDRPVTAEEVEISASDLRSYEQALGRYIRKGEGKLLEADKQLLQLGECKSLSVGSDADGGYWVTPMMADRMMRRSFETSPMRQFATVMTIGTDALEIVNDVNDATSGGWVGEKESRSETATPQIGKTRIPVHEQFAQPAVTQKLLDDASFNVEQWLADKITDKMVRTENTAFCSGNGVNQPRGFLDYAGAATTDDDDSRSWGVLQYVATGKSAAFDTDTVDATASPADELVDIQSKLKPIYRANANWFMNRNTEAAVRKLRATTGEYLVTMNTGNITGVPVGSFMLLGYAIANFEDMADIGANTFSVAFGDMMAAYTVVERMGTRILRDPFTSKPNVLFYTTRRVGGDVVDFDALKLLKFGTS